MHPNFLRHVKLLKNFITKRTTTQLLTSHLQCQHSFTRCMAKDTTTASLSTTTTTATKTHMGTCSSNGPFSSDTETCPSLDQLELAQVTVVFRHGARTPNSWGKEKFDDFTTLSGHTWDTSLVADLPGPCIPYKVVLEGGGCPDRPMFDDCVGVEVLGGCRTGQLTTIGKQQLRDLGERLKAEYVVDKQFLSASYNPEEVYTRTTYFQRTSLSLVNLLTGLYGCEEGENTPVVCIETKEDGEEDLYPNLTTCTKFSQWTTQFYAPTNIHPDVAAFESRINRAMGLRDGCERVWSSRLGDLIRCRRTHGFSIPQYLLDEEATINNIELDTYLRWFGKGNTPISRLCIGGFVNTLCERITDVVNNTGTHKLLLFSGHDWTVIPMLIVLGVDIAEWPPFASNIIFEVYRDTKRKCYVRCVYNEVVLVLDRQHGGEVMSVERFLEMLAPFRVSDMKKECGDAC